MIDSREIATDINRRIAEHYAEYSREFLGWSRSGDRFEEKQLPYRDLQSLSSLQRLGSRLFHESVLGRSIHENLSSYIVGTGHAYTVRAAANATVAESDIKRAQETVDAMLTYHEWPLVQTETLNRVMRTGDTFDRLVPNQGIVDIVRIEPHTLEAGNDAPFGIAYEQGDVRRPAKYFIRDGITTKAVDAIGRDAVICHGKRGVDSNDPRGVPLLWPAYCETRVLDELHHGFGKVIAALFEHIIVYNYDEAAKISQVRAIASAQDNHRKEMAERGDFGNAGGTHHAKGHTVEVNGSAFDASSIVQAFSSLTRRIGVLAGLPEFIITGDADTGSRNSLLSAEGPATRRFAREAQTLASYEKSILYHAIAASRGVFGNPAATAQIKMAFAIDAKPPLAETQDKPAETARILAAMRERVYSPQHACQLLGVDSEVMITEWERWEERLAKARESMGRLIGLKPEDVEKMVAAASSLIAAGMDPTEALTKVGLDPVEHIELVQPVQQPPSGNYSELPNSSPPPNEEKPRAQPRQRTRPTAR